MGGWGGMWWMGRVGILYDGVCIFIYFVLLVSDCWGGCVVGGIVFFVFVSVVVVVYYDCFLFYFFCFCVCVLG